MSRTARVAPAGYAYHVLNRSAAKFKMLRAQRDFEAFERVMIEAHRRFPLRICSYCIMPNHWHFVPWPEKDGQLSEFFRWLAHTHAMRWRVSHQTVGYGPLYQGRFKSFPVQEDEHLLILCRYVERNALTAGLVRRAEDWRWSSLWARDNASDELKALLCPWPVERPPDWIDYVNEPITSREIERIQISVRRDRPFGSDRWLGATVRKLGLEQTVRREGRPAEKRKRDTKKN